MARKIFIFALGFLMVMGLISLASPVINAEEGEEEGNFIFVNYIGQEINLDLDDVPYTVPGTDVAPNGGKLILQLTPGQHKYTANSPGIPIGSGGEFTFSDGEIVAKGARIEQTPLKLDPKGIVLKLPEDYIYVFDFTPDVAPVEVAPVVDAWQPVAVSAGQGGIVWVNYYGDDALTVDLAGQLYQIPPQVDGIPGRLQIETAPGLYPYTVSLPYGSSNGEVTVIPGLITGVNVVTEVPEPVEYKVGDEFEGPPEITLHLSEEDFTTQADTSPAQSTDDAPPVLPDTGGEAIAPLVDSTAPGLVVKNYAGDTLIFTINGQAYSIANNAEQILDLPPGQYNYTASLPFIATTGTVDTTAGNLQLSIVADVNHGVLNVYQ